ncbi:unnamed protein product [Cylicocyclus nassatus]|uniref:Uncharacterized protein n=1 Tax=Cylicocyclus nassatus TaxID=53992 RepID=A0AA36GLW8_CYLNA|nr:unnamed protein product [Cylicocyclus nassatus]
MRSLYFPKHLLQESCGKYKLRPDCPNDDDMTSLHMRSEEQNPEDGIKGLNLAQDERSRGFLEVVFTPTQWIREVANKGIVLDDAVNVFRYYLRLAALMVAGKKRPEFAGR